MIIYIIIFNVIDSNIRFTIWSIFNTIYFLDDDIIMSDNNLSNEISDLVKCFAYAIKKQTIENIYI